MVNTIGFFLIVVVVVVVVVVDDSLYWSQFVIVSITCLRTDCGHLHTYVDFYEYVDLKNETQQIGNCFIY